MFSHIRVAVPPVIGLHRIGVRLDRYAWKFGSNNLFLGFKRLSPKRIIWILWFLVKVANSNSLVSILLQFHDRIRSLFIIVDRIYYVTDGFQFSKNSYFANWLLQFWIVDSRSLPIASIYTAFMVCAFVALFFNFIIELIFWMRTVFGVLGFCAVSWVVEFFGPLFWWGFSWYNSM